VNANNRVLSRRAPFFPLFATLLTLFVGAGCQKGKSLELHYAADFTDAKTADLFFPAKIGIVPVIASAGAGNGMVFDADGYREAMLFVPDLSTEIARMLAKSLSTAGLAPLSISNPPRDGLLPLGLDFAITAQVLELRCVKRYIPVAADASPDFTMSAVARIKFTLIGRGGTLYSASKLAEINEPPRGANLKSYAPPIAEPADALSSAVSQTLLKLVGDPEFQQVLPQHTVRSRVATPPSAQRPGTPETHG
jgi:hypothetical protein